MNVLSDKTVSFKYILFIGFILTFHSSILNGMLTGANAEETCTWTAAGEKVCNEDETEKAHNVWTDPLDADEVEAAQNVANINPLKSYQLNELEVELFVLFASQLEDWKPDAGLERYRPEVIILAILNAFNAFDHNDDGFVDYNEIETALLKREELDNLERLKEILDELPENKISLFECLKIFYKFNDGKETTPLLTPYEKLQYLKPADAKKIIQGSVQMFLDSDKNHDSKLDKDEFSVGMKQAQDKRKEMGGPVGAEVSSEQIDALFTIVDKDGDKYLTYLEFQGTIPDKPKSFEESMDEVFTAADTDSDGKLSEAEFTKHMNRRSNEANTKTATEKEISDAFEKLDANSDGTLSREEMMNMLEDAKKAHEQKIMEAFISFDKDADGSLSLEELKEIVKGVEQTSGQKVDAELFMSMLDQNSDKKVSLEEMTVILTKLIK